MRKICPNCGSTITRLEKERDIDKGVVKRKWICISCKHSHYEVKT